jgi:hypothetical protein
MFLLGAGASVEARVPDAHQMTRVIVRRIRKGQDRHYSRIVSFVVGGLLFEQGTRNRNPLLARVNVEDLFNAILLLAERRTLEAAPFIAAWHQLVDDLDRIAPPYPSRALTTLYKILYDNFTHELRQALPSTGPHLWKDIDAALARLASQRHTAGMHPEVGPLIHRHIIDLIRAWMKSLATPMRDSARFERAFREALKATRYRRGDGAIFHALADEMVRMLAEIVWIEESTTVAHLAPALGFLSHQTYLPIASLNYDNAVELLASAHNVPLHTGIDDWSNGSEIRPPQEGVFLLKLHGSIDWKITETTPTADRPLPHYRIERLAPLLVKEADFRPAVVFGQRNKLTADGPFLDILRAFVAELGKSDRLTVVGYSFRDDHVNTFIAKWLNDSPSESFASSTRHRT